MKLRDEKNQQGVIMLIVIIIVAAVTAIYGLSIALLNLDEVLASYAWLERSSSIGFVQSCVDEAITRAQNKSVIVGSGNNNVNLSISNVTCSSTITGLGDIKTIQVSATATDAFGREIVSRVELLVNTSTNPFTVESYKDILD